MAVEVSQGTCDLCGAASDATLQECNWLTCTFQHCEGGLYHQECLEKYLKSNKLEKNRKTGFKCPRGCGKGTRFDQACPGRIDKSHPIHPRNEDKKKTKLAVVVETRPVKPAVPVVPNGKAPKAKDEGKVDAGKDPKSATPVKAAPAAKMVAPAGAALAFPLLGLKAPKKEAAALPPRPEVVAKQKLAELAAQARREIGLPAANAAAMPTHGSKGDLLVLAGAAAGPSKPVGTAAASAWGKPSAPAPDPPAVSPQPTMMSQLPQFQQLLQQAVGKKPAGKPTAPAAPAPVVSASRPTPAVPQPVLNPPTPVWPAMGPAQTPAAALFSAPTPSVQTPRESAQTPAPPSAWGSSAATASVAPQQPVQQPAQQQAAASGASTSQPSAPRSHAGTGTGGNSTSAGAAGASTSAGAGMPASPAVTGTSAPASSSAASAALASSPSVAAAVGTSVLSSAPPAAPGLSAASAAPPAGTGAGAGLGSAALARSAEACTSGRVSTADPQDAADAAAASPASAPGAAASLRGGQLVGADFMDDEVKEQKLTKAQRKNLKRTEKKKVPSSSEQLQGCGDGGQEASETQSRGSLDGGATPPHHSAAGASAGLRQGDAAATSVSGSIGGGGSGVHQRHPSRGSDDPEHAHIAEAEEAAVMEELCINCIVARKVLALVTQLQRLGAMEFVAAAAVQRHGSNLLGALEWLLVAGADAAAGTPEAVLMAAAESTSAAESEIDISEELQQLSDLQAAMGVNTELLQQCVLDCNGDVETAANAAMERMLSAPSGLAAGVGRSPAAGGVSGGDGRVGSGSLLAAGHHGNGMQMRGSASFYSISSLEGAAGGLDGDSALHHQQQHQQQQRHNSHFGVRLQGEAAVSSYSGGGGGGGRGGYAAGFMRGGMVTGAPGWQNGYMRDSQPPQETSAGGASGRSSSRLLHWLRDESGRAATLEEEPMSGHVGPAGTPANGLLCANDPVLESPFAVHGDVARGLAAPKAASESPSLHTWLGSNGYHPHHQQQQQLQQHYHQGTGGAAVHPGAVGPGGPMAGGLMGGHELYRGTSSNGNFSFMSALSKPTSSMAAQSGTLDALAGYGSRWDSLGASGAQRQETSAMLIYASAAAPPEADSAPQHEAENDLSSIMALINVR